MIQAKCIQKFRNKNNHIYGYRLQDINGQTQDVESKNLKKAIRNGDIHVVNLTLTSDNRLVDSNEKQLQSRILGKSPLGKNYESIGKAMGYISYNLIDIGDSLLDVADTLAYNSGIEINAYNIEEYYDKPEFRDCDNDETKALYKLMIMCYTKCAEKKPKLIESELDVIFDEKYGYEETLEHSLEHENVDNITNSKLYKALIILLAYAKFQNFDNTLIGAIEKFIKKVSSVSMSVLNIAMYTCRTYYRYLDSKIFGTISNDYFTVGHKLTTKEKRNEIEYKNYVYVCHKDFNIVNGPKTPICALFKDNGNSVTVDIKLGREGYTSEHSVGVVGYIKDVMSINLNKNENEDNWGHILADAFNKTGKNVLEFAKTHPEILKTNELNKPIEVYYDIELNKDKQELTGEDLVDKLIHTEIGTPLKLKLPKSEEFKQVIFMGIKDIQYRESFVFFDDSGLDGYFGLSSKYINNNKVVVKYDDNDLDRVAYLLTKIHK